MDMGGNHMKRFVALLLPILIAGTAQAERVLVIMKDQKSFQAAHQAFATKGMYSLKGLGSKNTLSSIDGVVESSLEHINTLVIDTKNAQEIEFLKANPAVAYVEKEYFHELPAPVKGMLVSKSARGVYTVSSTPGQAPWGIAAVKAPEAWAASNQGEGIRVAVLDTGIDETHPALAPNFEQGKDFTSMFGNDYSDKVNHGTHVAGTIAAAYNPTTGFVGVAPKAKILAGRVCSENGCSNVAIASGINWAMEQKVDVVNLSLGGMWSTPAERTAISNALTAGVSIVAASGNDGSGRVSYPAALPGVIAVGAVDENITRAQFSQFGKELTIVAPGVAVNSSVPQGTGLASHVSIEGIGTVKSTTFQGGAEVFDGREGDLVPAGLGTVEDFLKAEVAGKFALISRGEISFADKVKNAMKAGATGAVIYNNEPGLIQGMLTDDGTVLPIAVFMIEQQVGLDVLARLNAGEVVSALVKLDRTDYSPFDGTSMASPHVAGVVALVKGANKTLTPEMIKDILTSTAIPLLPNDNNEHGAGMIDAAAAVNKALTTSSQLELDFN